MQNQKKYKEFRKTVYFPKYHSRFIAYIVAENYEEAEKIFKRNTDGIDLEALSIKSNKVPYWS